MIRALSAALVLSAAAGTALAQTASQLVEVSNSAMVAPFNQTADEVDDWDVYSVDGLEVGEVEEVLGTDRQTPTALAIDFEGNGGYADRDVVVPLDQFTRTNGRLVINADGASVGQMPEWDD